MSGSQATRKELRQPEMPEEVSTPEELSVSLQQEPLKWVTYLNDITNYVTFLQSHIQEQEKTLQARESYAETVTTEQNSVLREALDTNISLNGQVKKLRHQLAIAQEQVFKAMTHASVPTPAAQTLPTSSSFQENGTSLSLPKSTSDHRSDKIPDPPIFDGTKAKLREFVTKLRLKMIGNADRYPTSHEKLVYAANRLEGTAMDQLMPYITVDEGKGTKIDLESYEDLIRILEGAFGDPNKKVTAQKTLMTLRQRDRPFHEYWAEFQRYAPETGYNTEAKISFLTAGLSVELQSQMIHHDIPETLNEYVTLLQTLDHKDRAMRKNIRRPGGFTAPFQSGNTRASGSAPSKSSMSNTSVTVTTPKPEQQNVGDPMDLSMQRGNPFASKPEMNRRRAEGLCLGCGGTGHFLAHCPTRRSSNKTVQGNSGQLLLMPAPDDTPMETGNDTSLGIVALRDS